MCDKLAWLILYNVLVAFYCNTIDIAFMAFKALKHFNYQKNIFQR